MQLKCLGNSQIAQSPNIIVQKTDHLHERLNREALKTILKQVQQHPTPHDRVFHGTHQQIK
jgi:NADH:ubiquinone oxidoreductase subunit E